VSDFRLKVFCTVAELQSFTRAGQVLYITQPAVSFQIKSLEEEFGARLFIREQKRVILTDVGKVLFKYAREILNKYKKIEKEIEAITKSVKGKLTIGMTTIIGKYYLPPIIKDFKSKYPDVEVLTRISNTQNIVTFLIENTLDLCIVSKPLIEDRFLYIPYIRAELVLIVPPDHRWVNKGSITFEELLDEPFIVREDGSGTRDIIAEYLQQKGKRIEDLNIIMTLGNTEAIKGAVESGAGVSIIQKCAIKTEVNVGSIRIVNIEDTQMFQSFAILYPKKFQRLTAERFLRFIQESKVNFAKIR
jgi:DNA-binding transcriptional LysR family regulator